jgi:pentatricopeptide repeat protein
MNFDRRLDDLLTSNFDTEYNQEELATLLDLLKTSSTSVEFLARWKKLDMYDREQMWPTLLIKVARESPHQLMKFLSGTWVAPYPPFALMTDAVNFVVFHHLSGLRTSEQSQMSALVLYRAIKGLLLQGPFAYVQLSQHSIFMLMQHLVKPAYIADVYQFLNQIGNPLTVDTLSHFVAKLAIDDEHGNLAYDIFRRIGDMQPNFNDHSLQSLCTTVLMHSHQEMEYSHSEKFEYMLKCGLTPNIITYNTLLLKLLKSGDTSASWEIFRLMKENGPEPDAYTMSTLLNDAKLRRDTACVSEILSFAQQKGVESAIMTTDILHLTSLVVHEKNSREKRRAAETNEEPRGLRTPFELMLPYYCKHFHFQPLAHLLPGLSERYPEFVDQAPLTPENIQSVDTIDEKRLLKVDPDNAVLVVMISTLLRDYDDADTPRWFYEHLKKLMKSQDPLVMQLARASSGSYALHLYNTIIMALGRHASNIPLCLQILGEMSPPKAEPNNDMGDRLVEKSPRDNESLVPRPTSATWGILTNIFMDHRQPRAAEKVISMMRERGIQPTTMNWGVLLKGYSRLQDAEAVVGAIQRTERAGFSFEKVTQRVFRQVADRRALMEGIRRYQLMKMKEQVETPRVVVPPQEMKEETSTSIEEMDVEKCGIGDMEVREVLSDEEILSQSSNRLANRDKKRLPGESEGDEDTQSHVGRTHRRRNRSVKQAKGLDHEKLLSYLADEIF